MDSTISNLPLATTILGTELVPIVQNGTTKRTDASTLIPWASPQSIGTTTPANGTFVNLTTNSETVIGQIQADSAVVTKDIASKTIHTTSTATLHDAAINTNLTVGFALEAPYVTVDTSLTTPAIAFPGVQIHSGDTNTLDDYEEGVWTPSFTLATPGNSSFTYSAQQGTYTKIGRLVVAHFHITLSAYTQGTGSGFIYVIGSVLSNYPLSSNVLSQAGSVSYATNFSTLFPNSGGLSSVGFSLTSSTGTSATQQLTATNITNTVDIYGTIIYTAAT